MSNQYNKELAVYSHICAIMKLLNYDTSYKETECFEFATRIIQFPQQFTKCDSFQSSSSPSSPSSPSSSSSSSPSPSSCSHHSVEHIPKTNKSNEKPIRRCYKNRLPIKSNTDIVTQKQLKHQIEQQYKLYQQR